MPGEAVTSEYFTVVPLTGDAPNTMATQGGKGWQGRTELKGEVAPLGGLGVAQTW